jgi:Zn-finger nucleic acid-binding protein
MQCPRCETASLTELDRDGVTIDRCERCRGVWLDRGELEKLLAYAGDERRGRRDDDDNDDEDDRDHHRGDRSGGRRGSWWEIFD